MDPLSAARYGMMTATRRFEDSAQRVALSGDPEASPNFDLGAEVVEQIGAKQQFAAQVSVIHVADEMWRDLLSAQEQTQRR
jgi:flagellar hook protein FlgE